MGRPKYRNISLPDKLIDKLDKYIKNHPELDFRSRAEVIKYCLRQLFLVGTKPT